MPTPVSSVPTSARSADSSPRSASSKASYFAGRPFYRMSKAVYGVARSLLTRLFTNGDEIGAPGPWVTMDELMERPLAVPYMMVTGPRWNTHALIASPGPFLARRRITIDTTGLDGANWYVVLHELPGNRMIQWTDHTEASSNGSVSFDVEPGAYLLAARFYPTGCSVTFPRVDVDGGDASIPAREAGRVLQPQSAPQFHRRSLFYDALHHHVFFALHHRAHFDASTVRKQYLPVGNPGTYFRYGAVRPGQHVVVRWTPETAAQYRLFLSIYNRSSFPTYSAPLPSGRDDASDAPHCVATPPVDAASTYLLRVVPRVAVPVERSEDAPSTEALHTDTGVLPPDATVIPSRSPTAPSPLRDDG